MSGEYASIRCTVGGSRQTGVKVNLITVGNVTCVILGLLSYCPYSRSSQALIGNKLQCSISDPRGVSYEDWTWHGICFRFVKRLALLALQEH